MKRRREGTLEDFLIEPTDRTPPPGICGLDDFIRRAEQLIEHLSPAVIRRGRRVRRASRTLREGRAHELEAYLSSLRRAPQEHKGPVYLAICAALLYAEILNELRDDVPSTQRGLTRTVYLKNKRLSTTRQILADRCGMSLEALRKRERQNMG